MHKQVSAIFAEYAGILASEGETATALKYIKGQGHTGAVLQDRSVIYMHVIHTYRCIYIVAGFPGHTEA